jgi:hypothetical protein
MLVGLEGGTGRGALITMDVLHVLVARQVVIVILIGTIVFNIEVLATMLL